MKQILVILIQKADKLVKFAGEANFCRSECLEIKCMTEVLARLLRQAARASDDLYERPARVIINETEQVLKQSLALVLKCRANHLRRVFTVIRCGAFRENSQQLGDSIANVSWLVSLSRPADDRGLPPIAMNEPILGLIWDQIAILGSGSIEERIDAANLLVMLAGENVRYAELIIQECGAAPGLLSCLGRTWKV